MTFDYETCEDECWTGDEDVYCSLPVGHDGKHDDGEGWEWPSLAATSPNTRQETT